MTARARRTDPHTSHEAAASVRREHTSRVRAAIVYELMASGPMCDTSLCAAVRRSCGMLGSATTDSCVRGRRSELVDEGVIEDTGERVVLDTGRKSIVWGLASQHQESQ